MIMIRTLRRDIARYNKEDEMVSKFNVLCIIEAKFIPYQTNKI